MNSLTIIAALLGVGRGLWGVARARIIPRLSAVDGGTTLTFGSEAGRQADIPRSPSPEAVAIRAHEIYLARGGVAGYDLDDWLQAERQLWFPSLQS